MQGFWSPYFQHINPCDFLFTLTAAPHCFGYCSSEISVKIRTRGFPKLTLLQCVNVKSTHFSKWIYATHTLGVCLFPLNILLACTLQVKLIK